MRKELQDLAESYGYTPEDLEETPSRPKWLTSTGHIMEYEFCQELLYENALCRCWGSFYDLDGPVTDEQVRKMIYKKLAKHVHSGFSKKVESLLYTLRIECNDPTAVSTNINYLHLANGTYTMDCRTFIPYKNFCRNRFPVSYDPDAPKPERWLAFLQDLLEDEDILTLQEYMGYCLFPTTRAQKMLMLIGDGGEGKSRIGIVMKSLFGKNLSYGSLNKVETNPFARADLEHVLVMVDDDMKMEALKQTNNLKSIITAEEAMDLEKKGIQSYQGTLFVRFLGFGNGSLKALHDRSYGFFRRQIIIKVKPRPADRIDDPFLDIRLKKELPGILMWCIEGWERLFCNNFQFTLSEQTRQNISESICDGCNALEFMESQGYFRIDSSTHISSRKLYQLYKTWCEDNSLIPLASRTFLGWMKDHAQDYGLRPTNKIPIGGGKTARGFLGMQALPEYSWT